jgi:hypothetical protein
MTPLPAISPGETDPAIPAAVLKLMFQEGTSGIGEGVPDSNGRDKHDPVAVMTKRAEKNGVGTVSSLQKGSMLLVEIFFKGEATTGHLPDLARSAGWEPMAELTKVIGPGNKAPGSPVVDDSTGNQMAGTMSSQNGLHPLGRDQAICIQKGHDWCRCQRQGHVAGAAAIEPLRVVQQPNFGKTTAHQFRRPILGAVHQKDFKPVRRPLGVITGDNDAQVDWTCLETIFSRRANILRG